MALFTSVELNSLEDLFCNQIEDLYDAESRLTEALPKMADGAHSAQLKQCFQEHLRETEGQVARLEQVFHLIGKSPRQETCEAMKGLVKEGDEMLSAQGDPDVKDAALIAAAQRVEHYEIASYGTARTLAQHLGYHEAARLLQETLDEEKEADRKLTEIAEQGVNVQAQQA